MKNNKGITLIALVVTIIVLLILAGVSIAMLTGDNGILSRSQEASYQNDLGNAKEEVAMKIAEAITNWNAVKYANVTTVTGLSDDDKADIDNYIYTQINNIKETVQENYDVAIETFEKPTATKAGSIVIKSNKDTNKTFTTTWKDNGSFSAWKSK